MNFHFETNKRCENDDDDGGGGGGNSGVSGDAIVVVSSSSLSSAKGGSGKSQVKILQGIGQSRTNWSTKQACKIYNNKCLFIGYFEIVHTHLHMHSAHLHSARTQQGKPRRFKRSYEMNINFPKHS